MSWKFWGGSKKDQPIDKLTDEYLRGDPKLIWQHQISGKKNFDSGDFLGALTDLSADPNWPEAFKKLPNSTLFIKRLGEFFDLNQNTLDAGDEKSYLYFSPRHNSADEETLLNTAQDFIDLTIKIAERADESELKKQLEKLEVKFAYGRPDEEKPDTNFYQEISDMGDEDFSIYEVWGDLYGDNQFSEWENIHYCLKEAAYGLAADYYLAYWLMQDFHTLGIDTQAYFDFVWRYNGAFYKQDNIIYVYQAQET